MVSNIDSILEEISSLSLEDQELIDEVMHKRIIEAKRDEIYADYCAAQKERMKGQIHSGSVDDLLNSV
ncbi:MAG TPA: hypothetical protein PLB48_12320 [Treponema sp.]|jgi:hypothetical protein|nr:hypothetical protein [Treponema sp.]HRS05176.1 hypothetical protein [Treponema sp.]HRU29680.1 hypothetical protein [Treponema sp.]